MIKTLSVDSSSHWIMPQKTDKNKNHKNDTKAHFGTHENKGQNDPLSKYPLRLCAYTNEIGAAVAPIPVIGPKIFMLSWVPALLYFGADIYDKYAKGQEQDYSNPSRRNAVKQATFQALASVLLPTGAVILGQNVASKLSQPFSKDGMDVRAKEDIIQELKRDINHSKLRNYKNEINNILHNNSSKSLVEIKDLDEIKKIKQDLSNAIFSDLKSESESVRYAAENKNLFKKFIGIFVHSSKDCEYVSKISKDKFDSKVKGYLDSQLDVLVDTRVALQRALNADGTMNEHTKDLKPQVLKNVQKILKRNIGNRNIKDKTQFVVKECVLKTLNSSAMKLSGVKIVGGFVSLGLLAGPIDKFVEHVVISKFLAPKLDKLKSKKSVLKEN